MINKIWYLSQIKLFDRVEASDMAVIDEGTRHTRFRKNTIIQSPDMHRTGLYFVKEGALRLYIINAEGKQFTVGILGKGSTFGEVESFSLGTEGVYVETLEDTLVCSISSEQFEAFIAGRPEMMKRVMRILSDNLNLKNKMLEKMALGTVKEKVIFLLLHLSEEFGVPEDGYLRIELPLSHQEIGHMIGATRESVTVAVHELAEERVLRTGRKSVAIDTLAAQAYVS
ncbi:Crp/Fnr family transcriptional regulator [Paenibacillus sp. NFR01]|uniref:Crp/Fnr family transcriptional regulator n=1 Tax=Paenibacillus sp. NFR01 TaxID=1566279 RepID=UPI0008C6861B|nr:Crp/Fnr family transcriptional regulator [Paenibacillus sp. NFR01]SET45585.1 CRP/FNR family transcriptional regulator, anaerobic regulatory protein [Paenibacillus sp. NFR01]